LQRNPRNSLEQLGQIDDASFFTFSVARAVMVLIAVAIETGTGAERDECTLDVGLEL
jgi:hypothetical protein